MRNEVSTQISDLMARFRSGDREAAGQLIECLYPELRRIAASKMRSERAEHTWSPTVLVNELFLELVKIKALRPASSDNSSEKTAFLGLAGHLMRRLLIHHSRPLSRKALKVEVDEADLGPTRTGAGPEALVEIEMMLDRLMKIDPKFRTVVEMRAFEGKTIEEIAAGMGCAPRTAATYWGFAKRWLQQEFDQQAPSAEVSV